MTRLIDADILKEAINTYDKFACLPDCKIYPFRELKHPEMFVAYIHFSDIIKAIDNAPTVPLPDFKDGYKQAVLDGKTNYSRPKDNTDLCKTCKLGDVCELSTKKAFFDCRTTQCSQYKEGGRQ